MTNPFTGASLANGQNPFTGESVTSTPSSIGNVDPRPPLSEEKAPPEPAPPQEEGVGADKAQKYSGPVEDLDSLETTQGVGADDDKRDSRTAETEAVVAQTAMKALVAEARHVKARMDLDRARYDEIKADLWVLAGRRPGEFVDGAKFRAPSTSRRCDYKKLEATHPDVYAEVVTVTQPNPDTPGALTL